VCDGELHVCSSSSHISSRAFFQSPLINRTVETVKTAPVVAAGTPTPTPLPARPGEIEDPSGQALDASSPRSIGLNAAPVASSSRITAIRRSPTTESH
jgi:hypothetical protein